MFDTTSTLTATQTAMNTTINDHKRKLPVEKFGTLVSRQISPDPKMTWISMDYVDAPDARPNNLDAGCSTLPAR